MPTEKLEFKGDSIDSIVRLMEKEGATATTYNVHLYDGETAVGMASGNDYNTALLAAAQEAGVVKPGVDLGKYRTEITVQAKKPYAGGSRPAGAAPAEPTTARYTNWF